jgi:ribonuclease E
MRSILRCNTELEPDQAEPDQAEPDQAEPDQAEPDQAGMDKEVNSARRDRIFDSSS